MLTSLAGLKFLDWLPPYYRDDAVVADYLQIAGFECDRLAYLLGQFVRQHYIGTSEWLLTTLEAFYGLRNPGLTLDLRRAVLLSMTLGHLRLRLAHRARRERVFRFHVQLVFLGWRSR